MTSPGGWQVASQQCEERGRCNYLLLRIRSGIEGRRFLQEGDAVPERIGAMQMDSGEVRVLLKETVDKEPVRQRLLILLFVNPPTEASAKISVHKGVVPVCKEFAPPDTCVMNSDNRGLGKVRSN